MDRFGACSPCPTNGTICEKDALTLAPGYYWRWLNKNEQNEYQRFVENIVVEGPSYHLAHSKFTGSLPIAHRCIRQNACLGRLKSECSEGYTGLLCSQCKSSHYLRMNTCERCPTKLRTVFVIVGVVLAFILIIIAVIWGDSRKAGQNRTWADVILSRFKIVISFYQVIMGVFSALTRVEWPASIVVMTKWLRYVEANILELGPLSCLDTRLRFDPLQQFALAISVNIGVVLTFTIYLKIRGILIHRKENLSIVEKNEAHSAVRKSCYRNIFLFLFTTYPSTCVKIVQITPPACIPLCFSQHETKCSSFLLSDFSVKCFTARYNTYWPLAMVFLLYPLGFPILVLGLLWKFYHKPSTRPAQNDKKNFDEGTHTTYNQTDHFPHSFNERETREVSTNRQVVSQSTRGGHSYYGSIGGTASPGYSDSSDLTDRSSFDDAESNDEESDSQTTLLPLPACSRENERRTRIPDITFALSLFYENYKRDYWFWEVIEMYRKLILVTGLSLIGSHSRSQVGVGVLLAGGFSVLHAAYQPITDRFENALQTTALLVVFFDLTLGVMLKIADNDIPVDVNTKNDNTGVGVLFVLVNSMVIAIALGKLIMRG